MEAETGICRVSCGGFSKREFNEIYRSRNRREIRVSRRERESGFFGIETGREVWVQLLRFNAARCLAVDFGGFFVKRARKTGRVRGRAREIKVGVYNGPGLGAWDPVGRVYMIWGGAH